MINLFEKGRPSGRKWAAEAPADHVESNYGDYKCEGGVLHPRLPFRLWNQQNSWQKVDFTFFFELSKKLSKLKFCQKKL